MYSWMIVADSRDLEVKEVARLSRLCFCFFYYYSMVAWNKLLRGNSLQRIKELFYFFL